jgi:hypothetical protein
MLREKYIKSCAGRGGMLAQAGMRGKERGKRENERGCEKERLLSDREDRSAEAPVSTAVSDE